MAVWRQDSTAVTHNVKKDYAGYKGTNVLSGPAVPILVSRVPEPTAVALLGIGAIGLLACGWRWRQRGGRE
jgi:Zn-dependent alcohol dehydrogenase